MSSSLSPAPIRPSSARLRAALVIAAFGIALAASPPVGSGLAATAPASASATAVPLPGFASLVKQVLPAVVNISVSEKSGFNDAENDDEDQSSPGEGPFPGFPPSPFDQFLRRFFNQQGPGFPGLPGRHAEQRIALGSGFIIDPAGFVVTNNHVVANADKVTVIFQDGSKHPAKVLGRDTKTDLALLKIDAKEPLPYVSWGDSNAAQVGDWVLAVGNPFGLGGTVSSGIVSARGRDIQSGPYDDFLQIDAAINRGNSGGPLFNLEGQVVGINTSIYSPNGGSVGIAFAIPSSLAKPVIEQLREHGKVERGWLGVEIQQVTPEIATGFHLPKAEGALIAKVTEGSPAAISGFKQGDVILSFNGHDIAKMRELPLMVAETPVGDKVAVSVWRGGETVPLDVTIAKMPTNLELAQSTGSETAAGLRMAPLTDARRDRLGVGDGVEGVVVLSVAPDSPLADLGIERGDVIEQINQQPVRTVQEAEARLNEVLNAMGNTRSLLILLNRHGISQYVAMTVRNGGANG